MRHLYHKKFCFIFVTLLFFAACLAGIPVMADDEPAVDGVSVQSGKKIKNQPAKPPERFLAGEDLKKKAEEYNRAAIDLFEQGKYP